MSNARALEKLAERLQVAKSPDRVLDRDIGMAVADKPHGWLYSPPHYTRSFEAALALLPPVRYLELSGSTDTFEPGVWPAISLRWLPPGQADHKNWHGTVQGAPTFALAMCRAAIEVRSRLAGNPARH
jgi:hypothetical protein